MTVKQLKKALQSINDGTTPVKVVAEKLPAYSKVRLSAKLQLGNSETKTLIAYIEVSDAGKLRDHLKIVD